MDSKGDARLSVVKNAEAGKVVVSIGGNAIIRRGQNGTIEEQFGNLRCVSRFIGRLVKAGKSVVITHGNGPMVGNIVLRNEAASDLVPPMPLYICDADSEGGVGFMIQQSLYNHLRKIHNIKQVVTVVTQVVVDRLDPAFKNPEKPLGPYYTKEQALAIAGKRGWAVKEDSGRGYRRVVPSPAPVRVVEAAVIKMLADSGVVVIACGGGGVPVVESADGTLSGVDAVIDKDLSTALIAHEIRAERFINLTQIDMVYTGFGRPSQKGIPQMDTARARALLEAGEFAPGSMAPKIRAAVEFIEGGGREVVITTPELIDAAVEGRAGTRIVRNRV